MKNHKTYSFVTKNGTFTFPSSFSKQLAMFCDRSYELTKNNLEKNKNLISNQMDIKKASIEHSMFNIRGEIEEYKKTLELLKSELKKQQRALQAAVQEQIELKNRQASVEEFQSNEKEILSFKKSINTTKDHINKYNDKIVKKEILIQSLSKKADDIRIFLLTFKEHYLKGVLNQIQAPDSSSPDGQIDELLLQYFYVISNFNADKDPKSPFKSDTIHAIDFCEPINFERQDNFKPKCGSFQSRENQSIALDFIIHLKHKIEEEKQNITDKSLTSTYVQSREKINEIIQNLAENLQRSISPQDLNSSNAKDPIKMPSYYIKTALSEINKISDLKGSIIYKHRKVSTLWERIISLLINTTTSKLFNNAKKRFETITHETPHKKTFTPK